MNTHNLIYRGEVYQVSPQDLEEAGWWEYRVVATCPECGEEQYFDSLRETYNGVKTQRLTFDGAIAAMRDALREVTGGEDDGMGDYFAPCC